MGMGGFSDPGDYQWRKFMRRHHANAPQAAYADLYDNPHYKCWSSQERMGLTNACESARIIIEAPFARSPDLHTHSHRKFKNNSCIQFDTYLALHAWSRKQFRKRFSDPSDCQWPKCTQRQHTSHHKQQHQTYTKTDTTSTGPHKCEWASPRHVKALASSLKHSIPDHNTYTFP